MPIMKAAATIMNPIMRNGAHILLAIDCIPVTFTGNMSGETIISFWAMGVVAIVDFLLHSIKDPKGLASLRPFWKCRGHRAAIESNVSQDVCEGEAETRYESRDSYKRKRQQPVYKGLDSALLREYPRPCFGRITDRLAVGIVIAGHDCEDYSDNCGYYHDHERHCLVCSFLPP